MAKILENMEIGHNVLHGQWDWMNHPVINSQTWDWDTASTSEAWKHSHNYVHHTFTNILGKDRDLGYEIMRIDPHQKWHPVYLLQPITNVLLMALFEWGVAVHDLDFTAIRAGEKSMKKVRQELKGIAHKGRLQIQKDYVAWPALSAAISTAAVAGAEAVLKGRRRRTRRGARALLQRGPRRDQSSNRDEFIDAFRRSFLATVKANVTANVVRNVWSNAIIFCGHFPDQTYVFNEEEVRDEQPGGRYVRQLIGAANIEGGPFFHVMSGNLGYQVEHHLYPDMPSSRYGEIAPRVAGPVQALRPPLQHRPVLQAVGGRAADDPAPGLPGRKAPAQARPLEWGDVHQPWRAGAGCGGGGPAGQGCRLEHDGRRAVEQHSVLAVRLHGPGQRRPLDVGAQPAQRGHVVPV